MCVIMAILVLLLLACAGLFITVTYTVDESFCEDCVYKIYYIQSIDEKEGDN